jgi:hypothetical protein
LARENSLVQARIAMSSEIKLKEKENCKPRKSPPKLTIDECLQKLRRHSEKLKEKLNLYSFTPVLYKGEKRKEKVSKPKRKKFN